MSINNRTNNKSNFQKTNSNNPKWTEDPNHPFINPYNFISLVGTCKRHNYKKYIKSIEENKPKTGWLSCTINTKTPIFIPNTTNEDAFNAGNNYKTYDFFSYEDISGKNRTGIYSKPVIPGSEIRGVIRSAFEAVTNSCLSTLDTNRTLYRRTVVPKIPGILTYENGNWYIEEAERVMILPKNYEEGQKVYFTKSKNKFSTNKGGKQIEIAYIAKNIKMEPYEKSSWGYYHRGEPFRNKHHESIFVPNGHKFLVEDEQVDRLRKVLELYKEEAMKKSQNKNSGYSNFSIPPKDRNQKKDGKVGALIYYSEKGKYMSPACISKEVFKTSLYDIVKEQGQYQPCDDENLCNACLLFGTVNGNVSIGSRVRFTDGIPEDNRPYKKYYGSERVLNELSSPKLSSTEFYLEKYENAELWDYDNAYSYERNNAVKINDYQAKIRGRKFYWHSRNIDQNAELTDKNCKIRPVKENISFEFKVYFNDISEEELKRLIWVLNIGNNYNANCHKIGKGKSIGYGSIKITVNKAHYREIVLNNEGLQYKMETLPVNEIYINNIIDSERDNVKEFLRITDLEKAPMNITYPLGDDGKGNKHNSTASHQWFAGNRAIKANPTRPRFYRTLPKILRIDNEKLFKMIKK